MSSQMASAASQRPPSAAARMAAVKACTEGAMRLSRGASRICRQHGAAAGRSMMRESQAPRLDRHLAWPARRTSERVLQAALKAAPALPPTREVAKQLRAPAGARTCAYASRARSVSPLRPHTSTRVVHSRQSISHLDATASSHTCGWGVWRRREAGLSGSEARHAQGPLRCRGRACRTAWTLLAGLCGRAGGACARAPAGRGPSWTP